MRSHKSSFFFNAAGACLNIKRTIKFKNLISA